jgi:hypothetical protein
MANTLLTLSNAGAWIAKETLMHLRNNLVMGRSVHRTYKNEFVGKKKGNTITIEKPPRFTVTESADITNDIQDIEDQSITLTVDKRAVVAWQFTSEQLTLDVDDFSEKYILPAAIQLANHIDYNVLSLYKDVYWAAGTAGSTPSTFAELGAAARKLDEAACPTEDRKIVMNSAARWSMADALKGAFSQPMVEGMIRRGSLGQLAEMDIMLDQNVRTHTRGALGGTPLVNGASQTGATLATDGWTASTAVLNKGDVFTLTSVYAINPKSRVSTGQLQQFTVTADSTSDASGELDIPISPSIITSGAYQTVSASPANNEVPTFLASHTANIAFHKNAFALVTVPLHLPGSASWKHRYTHDGLSIRVVRDYGILTDVEAIRLDMQYGIKTLYPELACRLLG